MKKVRYDRQLQHTNSTCFNDEGNCLFRRRRCNRSPCNCYWYYMYCYYVQHVHTLQVVVTPSPCFSNCSFSSSKPALRRIAQSPNAVYSYHSFPSPSAFFLAHLTSFESRSSLLHPFLSLSGSFHCSSLPL